MPNITGTVVPDSQNADTLQGVISGAFYRLSSGQKGATAQDYKVNSVHGIGINASRSSSIYGSSKTVTPLSQSTLWYMKY